MQRLYAQEPAEPPRVEVYVRNQDSEVLGGTYGVMRWGRWFDLEVVWLSEAVRGGGTGGRELARFGWIRWIFRHVASMKSVDT